VYLAYERKEISTSFAAKTVEHPLVRADSERGCLLMVKRTQPDVIASLLVQFDVMADTFKNSNLDAGFRHIFSVFHRLPNRYTHEGAGIVSDPLTMYKSGIPMSPEFYYT
jgi:hypothetical protein